MSRNELLIEIRAKKFKVLGNQILFGMHVGYRKVVVDLIKRVSWEWERQKSDFIVSEENGESDKMKTKVQAMFWRNSAEKKDGYRKNFER